MPRVAVTGGSGKLGRAVVTGLLENGWQVVNLDQRPPATANGEFIKVDFTDFGQTLSALTGVDDRYDSLDAVVHLAAIPAPGLTTNAATFQNNMVSTYNVFAACAKAGITNVVWASSETVLGLPFETPPPYLPVDEEYPARPQSSYSLAKHLEEQMAAQWCRWNPALRMRGLRFSNVMDPVDYQAFPAFDLDASLRQWNLWGYIDARDGAQAVRKALEYSEPGMEVFIIANADTVMNRSSASLAAEVFPDVEVRRELGTHETLLCIDKAKRLLGFTPEFSWRDQ